MGKSTFSGPVAGAYITVTVTEDVAASGTSAFNFHVPDGQTWKFFGASLFTSASSGTHTATITVNSNSLISGQAITNVANYVAAATPYTATDGQTVSIVLTADGAVALSDCTVVLYAYTQNHPDAL